MIRAFAHALIFAIVLSIPAVLILYLGLIAFTS